MISILNRIFGRREELAYELHLDTYRNDILEQTKRSLADNRQYMDLIRAHPDVEIMFPELRDGS